MNVEIGCKWTCKIAHDSTIVTTIQWHTHPSRLNNFSRSTAPRCKCGCSPAAADLKRIIREPTVNRPGLALSGFTQYFAYKRVQVFGNAEVYLSAVADARAARSALRLSVRLQNSVRRLQPRTEAGQGISGRRGKGGRAGFSNAAGDDEVHQQRDAGAGNDVRAARHGNGQHGGHPRRGRDDSRRKRHRQKRGGAGADRTRLQPRVRRRDQGHAASTAATSLAPAPN